MADFPHKLEKDMEALEMEVQALNAMRNELLKRVSKEESRGLQVLPQVREWVSMVEEIETKAIRLLDKSISELQKLSRYDDISKITPSATDFSKAVCMTLEEVGTHKSKGHFKELVERAPLSHVKKMLPLQKIVSREMLLEKAWKCLTKEGCRTLALYGIAGVGKTTLLAQIKIKFVEAGDVPSLVIFVAVESEEVEGIQDKIGEKLRLFGRQGTKEEKSSEIYKFLSRKRFVLLLDGMQRKVNLEEIGIPQPSKENGCKIVFTTHSLEACGSKWVDAVEEAERLSSEESWDLFQKTVGETTLKSHPDIPSLARIVSKKCGGLPITLILIGKIMSGKTTVREWHHAIHVLVSSTDREVPIWKFTYDNLPGDNLKLCFLYCALFPKNADINKQDLVDCWICEGIIDKEDREIAEIKGYEMIADLVKIGLLLENESGYGVKMHGMVLEMALWLASDSGWFEEHFVVKWGEGIRHMVMDNDCNAVTRISVTSTPIETISGSPPCAELRTLFLQGNDKLRQISGTFFQWMTSLAVLNLSCNRELSELPEEVSSLVSLHLLNLSWTWINRLPLGLKELKKLIHLDLDHTSNLEEIEVIASLLNLHVLRLYCSVPMDLGLVDDIQRLKGLKELSLTVVEDAVFARLLSSDRLTSCIRRLSLRDITITHGVIALLNAMFVLRELDIFGCDIPGTTIDWRSSPIQMETVYSGNIGNFPQFRNIRKVSLRGCNGVRDLAWLVAVPNLEDLTLVNCSQIEQVISKEKAMPQLGHMCEQPFQNLVRVSLNDLPELGSIYWSPLPFPVLDEIVISGCPKLRRLPFNSESAKGNQLRLDLDEEWIKGVEWEDEATEKRFSGFNNRFSRADNVSLNILVKQFEKRLSSAWSRNIEINSKEEWEIDLAKLEIRNFVIGSGTYGNVSKGIYDGQDVAVEVLDWERNVYAKSGEPAQIRALFRQVVTLWSKLNHPNVRKFVGASMADSENSLPQQTCCMVVEYLPGGTLEQYLFNNQGRKLPFKIVIKLALDLSRGLSYLHSKKIVHRDVKTKKMFLDVDKKLKIAGFDAARVEALNPKEMTGEIGTLEYMAPEVINGKPYNRKCDVYSFGICLWEIYCCEQPYFGIPFHELSSSIVLKNLRPEIPRCCPTALANILKKCWDMNPQKRPEMEEVVKMLEGVDTSEGGRMIPSYQHRTPGCFFVVRLWTWNVFNF